MTKWSVISTVLSGFLSGFHLRPFARALDDGASADGMTGLWEWIAFPIWTLAAVVGAWQLCRALARRTPPQA